MKLEEAAAAYLAVFRFFLTFKCRGVVGKHYDSNWIVTVVLASSGGLSRLS